MGLRIKINFNADRITAATVTVEGISGQACLLNTAAIVRLNPQADLEATDEMYVEAEQEPVFAYQRAT